MESTRRTFLAQTAVAAGTVLLAAPVRAQSNGDKVFTPEMFGAKGDGTTNDSRAMKMLADAVSINGGGVVEFRRTTYLVGGQNPAVRADASYAFEPVRLLAFHGCRGPLIIRGNGARLKCAPGLRYGVFDPSGAPRVRPMPYMGPGIASPYRHMISVEHCTGPVEVADVELDGSVGSLQIGGGWGDTGWQIPAIGLALLDNSGDELVRNVHSHHHGQDGLYIDGVVAPSAARRLIAGVRADANGRQGCSIVGGHGYRFENCTFSRTGRSAVSSSPGAGVDIEAEGGKTIRNVAFSGCSFVDNAGCGLVADTGDSASVQFEKCRFVGTTNWSAWPNKPRFRFNGCTFAGALARAYGDADPSRAAQFVGCTFTDDPALSPTKRLYGGTNTDRPLADLSDAANMLFAHCTFLATHDAVLPWSYRAIYQDCRMEQSSPNYAFPRGRFLGRTTISGPVNLTGSNVVGEVIANGKRYAGQRL